MNQDEIRTFLESFSDKLNRTIVIVDFGNVDKWRNTLGWKVGIQELARLVKHFAQGNKAARRFYYGSDYGPRERSPALSLWSSAVLDRARMNRFEVITKPVKYIHDSARSSGFTMKCDLDVEMAIDLVRMKDDYDHIVVFSGDGDLVYALRYLRDAFGKTSYVFGARGHVGREIVDATREGVIQRLLYADDFKYRLDADRRKYSSGT
ncbi:NYN domain-containing protein [Sinimarinibacterium flocculans]|uniref:NYN domain-containing protein n=1 Tax=Sinimarinibacterium flocculans TaxID=985250 RepID=UPI0035159D7D